MRRKERLEREGKSLRTENDLAGERLGVNTVELSAKEEEIAALKEGVARQKRADEKLKKNLRDMEATLSKYQDELESQAEVSRALKINLEEKGEEQIFAHDFLCLDIGPSATV